MKTRTLSSFGPWARLTWQVKKYMLVTDLQSVTFHLWDLQSQLSKTKGL